MIPSSDEPTPAPQRPAFQWPPKPLDQAERAAAAALARAAELPLKLSESAAAPSRLAEWWREFEHAWLDPVAPPLDERARAAGWHADTPGDFCDRCGTGVGPFEADEFGCALCRGKRFPWSRCVRLGSYAPPLSEWIAEVKFTRWRTLGLRLGRLLGAQVRRVGAGGFDPARLAIVPVPMSLRRRLARGIDHSRVIAVGVARELGAPVLDALTRKHGPSQRAVAPSERSRNVARVMRPRRTLDLRGRHVLLIDDVMTTGATMRAAARALARAPRPPAAIWACTLAVTPDPHRRPATAEADGSAAGAGDSSRIEP